MTGNCRQSKVGKLLQLNIVLCFRTQCDPYVLGLSFFLNKKLEGSIGQPTNYQPTSDHILSFVCISSTVYQL